MYCIVSPSPWQEEEWREEEVVKEEVVERSVSQIKCMFAYKGNGMEANKGEVSG